MDERPVQDLPLVPGFYAVLASRPFRAIAPDQTLHKLGIGFSSLDFGKSADGEAADDGFRANLIRLQTENLLFQESDNAVSFLGRSLFRGSVDLPVNVPIGRYTTQVFLFRDGKLLSQSQSSLQVHKVGFERVVYMLAFRYPFAYGLLAVLMAVSAGLLAYTVFRRRGLGGLSREAACSLAGDLLKSGDPGVIRTCDPQDCRNLMLYPTELRGQPMGGREARRQRHFI